MTRHFPNLSLVLAWIENSYEAHDCAACEMAVLMICDGRDSSSVSARAKFITTEELLEAGEIESAYWAVHER